MFEIFCPEFRWSISPKWANYTHINCYINHSNIFTLWPWEISIHLKNASIMNCEAVIKDLKKITLVSFETKNLSKPNFVTQVNWFAFGIKKMLTKYFVYTLVAVIFWMNIRFSHGLDATACVKFYYFYLHF